MLSCVKCHLPETRLTNDDLAALFPEWPSDRIFQKTGIRERRVAGPDETAGDLAFQAAERLLEGRDRSRIGFVLHCTQSPDYLLPTTACLLQDRLGLPQRCGALDFNLGCSGYIYGLALADGLLRAGNADAVLLLTGETYTKLLDPKDKGTRTIFGDAGSATLLERTSSNTLHSFVFGTDGSGAEFLIVPGSGLRRTAGPRPLEMNGPEVFNFTVRVVPPLIDRILERARIEFQDVDFFVFHQANAFMIEHLRRRLRIPADKFALSLEYVGNTVSCSIPIAIESALADGKIRPGMRILLAGFGVGLSWAGCMLDWKG
ncbi:MAG TPA: ketoacyl-ACP synthase III [Verrucomicrobiota bacterium]|nr:ketoacyl-ACP synthase III [Verrucomicrobiota bacterium]HQK00551.1 ketoacyl-ACP synthase III [Verrucomicrobiota bacterium]